MEKYANAKTMSTEIIENCINFDTSGDVAVGCFSGSQLIINDVSGDLYSPMFYFPLFVLAQVVAMQLVTVKVVDN